MLFRSPLSAFLSYGVSGHPNAPIVDERPNALAHAAQRRQDAIDDPVEAWNMHRIVEGAVVAEPQDVEPQDVDQPADADQPLPDDLRRARGVGRNKDSDRAKRIRNLAKENRMLTRTIEKLKEEIQLLKDAAEYVKPVKRRRVKSPVRHRRGNVTVPGGIKASPYIQCGTSGDITNQCGTSVEGGEGEGRGRGRRLLVILLRTHRTKHTLLPVPLFCFVFLFVFELCSRIVFGFRNILFCYMFSNCCFLFC